jgi:hypothetical protein
MVTLVGKPRRLNRELQRGLRYERRGQIVIAALLRHGRTALIVATSTAAPAPNRWHKCNRQTIIPNAPQGEGRSGGHAQKTWGIKCEIESERWAI